MPGENVYERLGVRRIINASSWRTNVGGSLMPPPVRRAMDEAAQWFVDLAELNARAGETIARLTGAEAGLVTAGSAAGMLLEAAACMTRDDPAKIDRLPDTTGMKNEIVIHRFQRVTYDRCFRAAGAKLVEIGDAGGTFEWELEAAINERTAAVAYIFAVRQSGSIPLPRVVEIAHARGVPVIVDAAAMLPPAENLTRYVDMGADMVSFSGGKGVLGPQSTGILCGRADLIQAAIHERRAEPGASAGLRRSARRRSPDWSRPLSCSWTPTTTPNLPAGRPCARTWPRRSDASPDSAPSICPRRRSSTNSRGATPRVYVFF